LLLAVDIFNAQIPKLTGGAVNAAKIKNISEVEKYVIFIIIFAFLTLIFRMIYRFTLTTTARKVERDLRNDLYDRLIDLSSSFYDQHKIGDLIARLNNDTNAVRMSLGFGVLGIVDTFAVTVISIYMMWTINVSLTMIVFIPMLVIPLIVLFLGRKVHVLFKKVQEGFSNLSTAVQEDASGISVIKSYSSEQNFYERFEKLADEYAVRNIKLAKVWGLLWPSVDIIEGISIFILIYFGGKMIMKNELSIGGFTAFIGYSLNITWPMIALGWVINLYERGSASMKRIKEYMSAISEVKDSPDAIDTNINEGSILIKDLSFSYSNDREILKNINMKINPGDVVAIVGQIGSGKSTLIQLLSRMYEPPRNTIFIDGMDVRTVKLRNLRKAIGFVPQKNFLFADTIRNNLIFGVEKYDDKIIKEALRVARFDKDLDAFPKGLDTIIGEKGVNLSGGQKQRLSIARAIIKKPKILILDDSLSSVDTRTEYEIVVNLKELVRQNNMTTIFVTHRLASLKWMDKIFVIENGIIVESGTFDELMSLNGVYASMYAKQNQEANE
jgi:ATP-binding cassette subfamily B protein